MRKMWLLVIFFAAGLVFLAYGVYLWTYRHPADYTESTATISSESVATSTAQQPVVGPADEELIVRGHVFHLDIADTAAKRAQGLSGRDSLPRDSGMLFIFPAADRYSFWMKDMKFAIDIIWIDGNVIADISERVPPPYPGQSILSLPQYSPAVPVDKVLEINSGLSAKYGIKIGDKVTIKN